MVLTSRTEKIFLASELLRGLNDKIVCGLYVGLTKSDATVPDPEPQAGWPRSTRSSGRSGKEPTRTSTSVKTG